MRNIITKATIGVLMLLEVCTAATAQDLETANATYGRGVEAYQTGDMSGAVDAWSKALTIYKTLKGTEWDQASCCANIAAAMGGMGKYEESVQGQKQALAILKTIKGTEREQAGCYGNIGTAMRGIGKYEEAVQVQEQALAILKTIKGTEREQAGCHREIGIAMKEMDRYEEAIQHQEQAQKGQYRQQDRGQDHSILTHRSGHSMAGSAEHSRRVTIFSHDFHG